MPQSSPYGNGLLPSGIRSRMVENVNGLSVHVLEAGFDGRLARVTARDSITPFGAAAELVAVSPDDVLATARALVG